MTFWNGPIKFNVDEGSDTAASGLGPASPLTGNGASVTSGSGVVTGISTTGVSAGDLIWVDTSTGRKFGYIDSVDSSTQVTILASGRYGYLYEVTESGRNWAIGGKRETLTNARELFDNRYFGGGTEETVIHLETDQHLTGTEPLSGIGSIAVIAEIRSNIPGVKRKLTYDSASLLWGGNFTLRDLHIRGNYQNLGTTGGSLMYASTNGNIQSGVCTMFDCIIGDPSYKIASLFTQQSRGVSNYMRNCIFQNFTSTFANHINLNMDSCVVRNCEGTIFFTTSTVGQGSDVRRCIFHDNPGIFGSFRWGCSWRFWNNVVYNCGSASSPTFNALTGNRRDLRYEGCIENIFSSNTGILDSIANADIYKRWHGNGNYYYNNNFQIPNDRTAKILSSDPFVDAANGDFNLNTSTAGGRDLRALNYDFGS